MAINFDKLFLKNQTKSGSIDFNKFISKKAVAPKTKVAKTELPQEAKTPTIFSPFAGTLSKPVPESQKVGYGELSKIVNVPGGGQFRTDINTPRDYGTLEPKIGQERDHIIPVSLGGTSYDPNLQYLKDANWWDKTFEKDPFKQESRQQGKMAIELKAIEDYKSGKITLNQARTMVLNWDKQPPSMIKETVKNLPLSFAETIFPALKYYQEIPENEPFKNLSPTQQLVSAIKELPSAAKEVGQEVTKYVAGAPIEFALDIVSGIQKLSNKDAIKEIDIPVLGEYSPYSLESQKQNEENKQVAKSMGISDDKAAEVVGLFKSLFVDNILRAVATGGAYAKIGTTAGEIKAYKPWIKGSVDGQYIFQKQPKLEELFLGKQKKSTFNIKDKNGNVGLVKLEQSGNKVNIEVYRPRALKQKPIELGTTGLPAVVRGTQPITTPPIIPPVKPISPQIESTKSPSSVIELAKKTNEKITSEYRNAVLSGKKEDLRLDKEKNLSNLSDILGEDATPDTTLTFYRAGTGEIKPGDQITSSEANDRKYLGLREGSNIITKEIPLKDVVIGGGIRNEFFYAPKIEKPINEEIQSTGWKKLQETNPDLFNQGILRKSLNPKDAKGVIPENIHSIQGKWQNYGEFDEISADKIYKRIDSGSFKGEYEDKFGNVIRDKDGGVLQDVYDEDTGEWIKPMVSNKELRNELLSEFSTSEGKKYLNEVIDALPKNPDGTITAYRTGKISVDEIQSYTLSEGMAKTFSNQGTSILPAGIPGLPVKGYKNFGSLPTNIVKIDPKGIKAWNPYDAEILVESRFIKTKSQLNDIWNKTQETIKVTTKAKKEALKKPVTSRGKLRESSAFKRIQERLSEETQNIPTYNQLNLAEDTRNAIDFLDNYPKKAKRIALGLESPPPGITETAISIAVSEQAILDGDYKLAAQLETVRSLRQTRRGQEIVAERGRFGVDTPSYFIRQVLNARMQQHLNYEYDSAKGKPKKKMTDKISNQARIQRKIVDRNTAKIKDAQEFINSILC